jgi:MFS family permease
VGVTGAWFQTVGAQWLLVHRPHAGILVSLVQTATTLPYVLFGLVAGVLADTLDRRLLLLAVQAGMVAIGTLLAVLTFAGRMPPALLLLLVFLLGTGGALATPTYQSLVPDLVPRAEIPAAAALNSISINLARAVGPAIAGVLVAASGVGATFTVAAATALCYGLIVATWKPPPTARESPEPFVAALRAGSRYVQHSPVVKRILLRGALFLVPASSLFALLPLIAAHRLGLGSGGYGLLLAALGVGAVAGALVLPRARASFSINTLVLWASVVYAVALAAVALLRDAAPVLAVLLAAGVAWVEALLAAAALAAGSAATVRVWPFLDTGGMDRSTVVYWPEPQLAPNVDPDGRPVVVRSRYRVAPETERDFVAAMARVRDSRLRTGAIRWGLYREGESVDSFVELFVVPSWEEHLRQHHERLTGTDRAYEQRVTDLAADETSLSHLITVEVPATTPDRS